MGSGLEISLLQALALVKSKTTYIKTGLVCDFC